MIKKFFIFVFVCTLIGCQKDAVQLDNIEVASSEMLVTSDYENLSSGVRDIIINGGSGHLECETSNKVLDGESLGSYAYPYTSDMTPLQLYKSSLPCQPSIPYFLFGYVSSNQNAGKTEHSINYRLVSNPSYFDSVDVVDVRWKVDGQNDPVAVRGLKMNDLKVGESHSITCRVFSTDDNLSVYRQQMTFDFEVSIDIETGPFIEYGSGSTYACTNTGIFPIIAPEF